MKQRGFTLLELLTVISVISLLVTSAFVYLGNAREEARFAAALSFEQSVYNGLGDSLLAEYNFNGSVNNINGGQCLTQELKDNAFYTGSEDCVSGDCVEFLPDDTYNAIHFEFCGANWDITGTNEYTIGLWVNANEDADFYEGYRVILNSPTFLQINWASGNTLSWRYVYNNAGGLVSSTLNAGELQRNKWHYLTATLNSDTKTFTAYVDGLKVGEQTSADMLSLSDILKTFIGFKNEFLDANWEGKFDRFILFNKSLIQ